MLRTAITAMGVLGDLRALRFLRAHFDTWDEAARGTAVGAFSMYQGPEAIEALRQGAKDPSAHVRGVVADCLRIRKNAGELELLEAELHPALFHALSKLGDPRAVGWLTPLLDAPDERQRLVAAIPLKLGWRT